jgi:hypothetical protein
MSEMETYFARENFLWNVSVWFYAIIFFIIIGIPILVTLWEIINDKIEDIKKKRKNK